MNCERALLSFGFGRWGRIKEGAQGGTRLREESEIASFATAFVCLCVGVPVGTVGQLAAPGAAADAASGITPGGEAELEGIGKARELLQQMGCELPSLSKAMVEELEPLVSAGGAEYAERVHKLGAGFMARLVALKRLAVRFYLTHPSPSQVAMPLPVGAHAPPPPLVAGRRRAVRRPAAHLPRAASARRRRPRRGRLVDGARRRAAAARALQARLPRVRGGARRRHDERALATPVGWCAPSPPSSQWCAPLPTLAQVRDDDELAFSCRRAGVPPLPAPLQRADLPAAQLADAKGGGVLGHPLRDALFEPQDVLPLPPAWAADECAVARRPVPPPPPVHGPEQEKSFLSEKDFRARAVALLDALQEQERDREEQAVWEMEWEEALGGGGGGSRAVTRVVQI